APHRHRGRPRSSPEEIEHRGILELRDRAEATRQKEEIQHRRAREVELGDRLRPLKRRDGSGFLGDGHNPQLGADAAEHLERPVQVEELEVLVENRSKRAGRGLAHGRFLLADMDANTTRGLTNQEKPAKSPHQRTPLPGRNTSEGWEDLLPSSNGIEEDQRPLHYIGYAALPCPASDDTSNPPSTIATRNSAGTSPSRCPWCAAGIDCTAMMPPCTTLDHTVNQIKLRWACGSLDAISRKTPSVAYTPTIIMKYCESWGAPACPAQPDGHTSASG